MPRDLREADPARAEAVRKALASQAPLSSLRKLIPEHGNAEQDVVACACLCLEEMEEGSGLWSTLNTLSVAGYEDGLARMSSVLETIGAARARADLQRLAEAFARALRDGGDGLAAYIRVAEGTLADRIEGAAEDHAREIEDRLLAYCRAHTRELAAPARPRRAPSRKTRLARLRSALAGEDPLPAVRDLLPDDGSGAQEVVVHAFACRLETGSAGLSILFDRFEDGELQRIRSSLQAIGAARTLADLEELLDVFEKAVTAGRDRVEAAERVEGHARQRGLDGRHRAHVQEMEQRLLDFCRAHLEELAG